jgi:hypothetical protein
MTVIINAFVILFFLWIFTYPAKGIIRFLADFISDHMNHVPFLSSIVNSDFAIMKADRNDANIAEQKRAIRAKWLFSGIITGIFFYPFLGYVIFWVFCIFFGSLE